jgi:hypothetical protein
MSNNVRHPELVEGSLTIMPSSDASPWKALVLSVASDAKFREPSIETSLTAAENALGVHLPEQLRELLKETDGITADYGSGVIWSIETILQQNRIFRTKQDFRELYMPFDHLLFFGDAGGGDQFAFAIDADGQLRKNDIYRWEHETDARSWFAGHLKQFFKNRLQKQN